MQFSLFWLKLREIYWFGSLAWSIAVFSVTICPVGSVPVVSAILSTKRPTFAPSLAAASVLSKIQTFATSLFPAAVDASIARSKGQTSTQSPAPAAASRRQSEATRHVDDGERPCVDADGTYQTLGGMWLKCK